MSNQVQVSPVSKLKKVLNADSVKSQFQNALKENAGSFVASIIDLYGSDSYLQRCNPNQVVMEALRAATLKLPINKNLGFAYIVPYKVKGNLVPQFQIGYKGYIQLAMRTGKYKFLNSGVICEGIEVKEELLTGKLNFIGEKTNDKVKGYFAYLELLNGFSKAVYMSKEDVIAHAKKFSPSFKHKSSAWQTNFDSMGEKTVLRKLLSKFGFLSTEMVSALSNDSDFNNESRVMEEIEANANSQTIDIGPEPSSEKENNTEQKQMSIEEEPDF